MTRGARPKDVTSREIRVHGIVQGVGFRPTVWRLAHETGLTGDVWNDAAGVRIRVTGSDEQLERFVTRLRNEAPPLSRIDRIVVATLEAPAHRDGFRIVDSEGGRARTQVAPDAGVCAACRTEILSPTERRYRYPFTNCTHCGPRFSIVREVPYDRARTSMASFDMCEDCAGEYRDPSDRRFHAQPIACSQCGPKVSLVKLGASRTEVDGKEGPDDVEQVAGLIRRGSIVAMRGLGGFHLACDATSSAAVEELRARKRRDAKPFALMARDLSVVERYCELTEVEAELLRGPEAPIVLLRARKEPTLPDAVAPGLSTLGFMLPYTPLHLLVLEELDVPVVMTSANLSDAPQVVGNEEALRKLSSIADFALLHDRDIVNRIDDSVVRVVEGVPRLLRRARGYAPAAIPLPPGFDEAPDVLAFGGELKSTFCLTKDGAAVLSQHQGDLEDVETYDDYEKNLRLYQNLYTHDPDVLVADKHPGYLSSELARARAVSESLPLIEVQHHHAHVAACMVEHGVALDALPVLGMALDGLGYGDDGTLWGGELLLASYTDFVRLGTFQPIRLLGGAQAIRQPWRSLYAHLVSAMGWEQLEASFGDLELVRGLSSKPRPTLDRMLADGINSPWSSSCGRLFDAAAAAMGICGEQARYEAEGAMRLEARVDEAALRATGNATAYPFAMTRLAESGIPTLDPHPMWAALLDDLRRDTPTPIMAARFHRGLAEALVRMAVDLSRTREEQGHTVDRVVLTGGCFQNSVLLKLVTGGLERAGFEVLAHAQVPANDGGLALGQAAIAAATCLNRKTPVQR